MKDEGKSKHSNVAKPSASLLEMKEKYKMAKYGKKDAEDESLVLLPKAKGQFNSKF
jgi:hypothetical protein